MWRYGFVQQAVAQILRAITYHKSVRGGSYRCWEYSQSGGNIMSPLLEQVLSEIDQLGLEEQRLVMVHLTERVQEPVVKQKRRLSEFKGMVKSPLFGEDAQEWVSRTRREGDDRREELIFSIEA
jgi:hypothetical protein